MTDPQTPATEAGRRTRIRIERALGVHGGLEHESTEAERALLDEARTTALWIVDEQVPLIEAEARASLDVDVLALREYLDAVREWGAARGEQERDLAAARWDVAKEALDVAILFSSSKPRPAPADYVTGHRHGVAVGRADALREAAERVRAVVTEHSSDNGQYAKWGGDALLHDIQAVFAILDPQP